MSALDGGKIMAKLARCLCSIPFSQDFSHRCGEQQIFNTLIPSASLSPHAAVVLSWARETHRAQVKCRMRRCTILRVRHPLPYPSLCSASTPQHTPACHSVALKPLLP